MTIHDLHATLLHIMGLDHTQLTFEHAGRGLPPDRCLRRSRDQDSRLNHSPGQVQENLRLLSFNPGPHMAKGWPFGY